MRVKCVFNYPLQFHMTDTVATRRLPSIKQAISLLSAPEEVKVEVTAKIEAGESVTVKEIQRLKTEVRESYAIYKM